MVQVYNEIVFELKHWFIKYGLDMSCKKNTILLTNILY